MFFTTFLLSSFLQNAHIELLPLALKASTSARAVGPYSHTYNPEELDKEEAGLTYRYSYNGAGEAATW